MLALAAAATLLALPAYRSYVLRTQSRMAAGLLDQAYQHWQERARSDPRRRLLSLQVLGFPASTAYLSWDGAVHAALLGSETYRIALSLPAAPAAANCPLAAAPPREGFVLVAQPLGMQQGDRRCGTLCLSSEGAREVSGAAGAQACWAARS